MVSGRAKHVKRKQMLWTVLRRRQIRCQCHHPTGPRTNVRHLTVTTVSRHNQHPVAVHGLRGPIRLANQLPHARNTDNNVP